MIYQGTKGGKGEGLEEKKRKRGQRRAKRGPEGQVPARGKKEKRDGLTSTKKKGEREKDEGTNQRGWFKREFVL